MKWIKVDGVHINLSNITFIGEIFGDPSAERFKVHLSSGGCVEFKAAFYSQVTTVINQFIETPQTKE